MAGNVGGFNYVPGTYAKRNPGSEEVVGHYVRAWESRRMAREATERQAKASTDLPPCITFSRKIGVGALEIADIVARRLDYRISRRARKPRSKYNMALMVKRRLDAAPAG